MTKTFAMVVSLALIVTVAVSPVWAAGGKVRGDYAQGEAGETGNGAVQASRGTPVGESAQILSVQEDVTGKKGQSETSQILTAEEEDALLFMREEEKLARDVYLALENKWGLAVFYIIAESEQRHMDAVLNLLNKYDLEDPALEAGYFVNKDLQKLHNDLMAKGNLSPIDALEVGVIIEIEDIEDLENYLLDDKLTDKQDINRVFTNLLNGSYNHFAAFNSHLAD